MKEILFSRSAAVRMHLIPVALLFILLLSSLCTYAQNIRITDLPGQVITISGLDPSETPEPSVAGIGDINGDGFDDLAFGLPQADAEDFGRATPGVVRIVYGRAEWPDTLDLSDPAQSDVTLIGEGEDGEFGGVIQALGDINNDGFTDVGILAPGFNVEIVDGEYEFYTFGRGYLFFGGQALPATVDMQTPGNHGAVIESASGIASISSVGDFNNDGIDDLVIGEVDYAIPDPEDPEFKIYPGRGLVITGREIWPERFGTGTPPEGYLSIVGKRDGEFTGGAVAGIGDVDGDGFDDVCVNQLFATDDNYLFVGRAFVVYGRNDLDLEIDGETASGEVTALYADTFSGNSITSIAGGLNIAGDVLPDYAAGLSGAGEQFGLGLVTVIEGSTERPQRIDLADTERDGSHLIWGERTLGLFGDHLQFVPDLSGDGINELLVSAPSAETMHETVQEGRLFLISGSKIKGATTFVDYISGSVDGRRDLERLAAGFENAGDANGDGRPDLIIDSFPLSVAEPGLAYLVLWGDDPGDLNGDLIHDAKDTFLFAGSWQDEPADVLFVDRADRDLNSLLDRADLVPFIAGY